MVIKSNINAVIYQGRHLVGMDNPSPLMSQDVSGTESQQTVEETHTVSSVDVSEQLIVKNKNVWPTVAAKVEGIQEVPDRAMKCMTVKVQEAHLGSDICIEDSPNISRVGVESIYSRVREGHFSEALVVNISGAPITLTHG